MTSKRLFLKGMKEDLRHCVWMLALSLLGNFLTMPVLWLLRYSDVELAKTQILMGDMTADQLTEAVWGSINMMVDFYREVLLISAGIIAIFGAMIMGLESFRYLQHKSMVDTYHSLPVSRGQLFGIKYVNGLLIWLVPYLICMVLTLAISGVLLARVGGSRGIPCLIMEAGKITIVLLIVYLLIYHLFLLAVMLTGNMINTLVVAAIFGLSALSAYGLVVGFMVTFFRTYYPLTTGLAAVTYSSPLAAPVVLLGSYVDEDFLIADGLAPTVLACLVVALVLGVLAWIAYLKRPSERAGKGLDLWWIAGPLRLFVGIMGGMGGWLFMYHLVGGNNAAGRTAWSVFGALLTGILIYGVLDVAFSMDFKSFFRHKWSMGGTVAVTLLICFGFQGDWMGYDLYLPETERIRAVSIDCRTYNIDNHYAPIFGGMQLTDAAQIHAFLERGVENAHGRVHKTEDIQAEEAYRGDIYGTNTFYAQVVLDNGRSYCRVYEYYEWDEDVVLPLLCSEEYAKKAYYLTEETVDACTMMKFSSGADNKEGVMNVSEEQVVRELAAAYNRDLMEQPRSVILGEGRLLGQIQMTVKRGNVVNNLTMDILEGMTHTLEAMERNGIEIINQPTDAGDVESITFTVDGLSQYRSVGDTSISPAERGIRGYFGVYPEKPPTPQEPQSSFWGPASYSFTISDAAEIAQLMPLIQYSGFRHRVGVFSDDIVSGVSILDRSGTEWQVCLRRGALPEEFIQRFLEEAEK